MTVEEYKKAFEEAVGTRPSEEFLDRVRAAQAAGMTDEMLLDCLAYSGGCKDVFPGLRPGVWRGSRAGEGLRSGVPEDEKGMESRKEGRESRKSAALMGGAGL